MLEDRAGAVAGARSFAEMLEQTIRRYQNRAVEAAQVIEELVAWQPYLTRCPEVTPAGTPGGTLGGGLGAGVRWPGMSDV